MIGKDFDPDFDLESFPHNNLVVSFEAEVLETKCLEPCCMLCAAAWKHREDRKISRFKNETIYL